MSVCVYVGLELNDIVECLIMNNELNNLRENRHDSCDAMCNCISQRESVGVCAGASTE